LKITTHLNASPVPSRTVRAGGLARPAWATPAAIAALAGMAWAGAAAAQSGTANPPPVSSTQPDSFDGRPIREVVIRQPAPRAVAAGDPASQDPGFAALDATLEQLVLNQIRSRPGSPYSREEISSDITRINRLARFKQVDVRAQLLEDGSVRLFYTVLPQNIIADVQLAGNKIFSDTDIAKEVDILVGTPIDEWELDRAARRIEAVYRAKGYYLAAVRVNREELAKANVVLFEITEGERTRVRKIRFDGNKSFTESELRKDIKTREYFWPLESGPLDTDALEADSAIIRNYYRDRGYLNARVDHSVQTSPDSKEATVTFIIDEDVPYTLRNVEVEFAELRDTFATEAEAREFAGPAGFIEPFNDGPQKKFRAVRPGPLSTEQIMGHMFIKPGDVYSADLLEKSSQAIIEALGKLGYCGDPDAPSTPDPQLSSQVRIIRRDLRDEKQPFVDVLVVIRGVKQPYKVGELRIVGNDITQDKVIRREIALEPGRPLDGSQVEFTQKKIERTQLFAPGSVKITLQKPDPEEPEYRDVLVTVQETNTGAVIVGGIIGSDGGATAQITFRQRNFDVADTPDTFSELFAGRAFRGAGQVFSVDVLPGNVTQTYQISLSEPNLFETNTGAGIAAYYKARDYREYDEQRLGTQINVTRRLGDRWNLSAPLRIEQAELNDIEPDSPVDYFAVQDPNVLTTAGITLTRTTLDDPIIPSKGNKLQFGFEQAGLLGGDFTYTVLAAEAGIYIPLYEDFFGRRTVLSLQAKTRYIPQDVSDVPVFERFYLGGSNMRGFGFRTVSPRGIRADNGQIGDDPVGGIFSFNQTTEVKQPIYEDTLALVAFADSGTVNNAVSLANYRLSVGVGIRLKVEALSPIPLAFDFGFPIVKEDGDRDRIFTFNVDIPF
jgi:outer membrane protein insertion porin family